MDNRGIKISIKRADCDDKHEELYDFEMCLEMEIGIYRKESTYIKRACVYHGTEDTLEDTIKFWVEKTRFFVERAETYLKEKIESLGLEKNNVELPLDEYSKLVHEFADDLF